MQLFHPAKRRNCVSNRGINWKDNAGLRECYLSSFSVRFAVLMRIYPNTAKKSFGNSNQIPFKPAPPLSSSALFQRTALDSFMGWADKAITKHVTRLVERRFISVKTQRKRPETLEPAAATCIQKSGAHSRSHFCRDFTNLDCAWNLTKETY